MTTATLGQTFRRHAMKLFGLKLVCNIGIKKGQSKQLHICDRSKTEKIRGTTSNMSSQP